LLGEDLHLSHLLVERHESLVEESAEPFELALAADLVQCLDLALHLVGRAGQRILDLAHALERPLGGRQGRVGVHRILRGTLGRAERLPEAEAAEIVETS
jgi:hypothetical protein